MLREKSPYSELFCSVLSNIRTEYERYRVSLRIQSECRKTWTRITPNTDTFYAVSWINYWRSLKTAIWTIFLYSWLVKKIGFSKKWTLPPEQFLKNSPGTTWFRGKSLLYLIRPSEAKLWGFFNLSTKYNS